MNVFKNLHFALFASFDIHVKNTNFTFGIPHTHIQWSPLNSHAKCAEKSC